MFNACVHCALGVESSAVLRIFLGEGGHVMRKVVQGPIVALTTYDCQKWSGLAKTGQGGGAVSIAKVVQLCRRRSLGLLPVMLPQALNIFFC